MELLHNHTPHPCTIGRSGLITAGDKREGDWATPIGSWPLRECWWRPDRLDEPPATGLPLRAITPEDGWCDDPAHPLYNQHFVISRPPTVSSSDLAEVAGQRIASRKLRSEDLTELNNGTQDPRVQDYVNRAAPTSSNPEDDTGSMPTSFEHLWRDDNAYNLIIPLGYNDDPIISGKGSAIFLHVMHDDGRDTAGCVALKQDDLLAILPTLSTQSSITISQQNISIVSRN